MDRNFRRRERLSLVLILVLGIAALSVMIVAIAGITPRGIENALHASSEDGSWKAISFDGLSMRSRNYLLVIRRGQVVGGYDDCNGWSYEDEKPGQNGERIMLSTLVQCSPDEAARRLYRILADRPKIEVLGENEIRLSRDRHQGLFRRCKPDNQRFSCAEVR